MVSLHRLRRALSEHGPKELLARAAEEAKRRISDRRTVLVLRVDLTDPRNRLRARDRDAPELLPFDRRTLPDVIAMVERYEPVRVESVRRRFFEGVRGFVAYSGGAPIGYVFWVEGTDHPARRVHSDLHWLGVRPRRDELYTFDYYVIEPARGRGALFVRSVQEEHFRMGYTGAYGYVFSSNRAALWLYRTTGWAETARIEEHRVLSRFVVVGSTVYLLHALSRSPLVELPRP